MKNSGVIFTFKLKKTRRSYAWSIAVLGLIAFNLNNLIRIIFQVRRIKIIILIAVTGILWLNITRVVSSTGIEDKSLLAKIVELAISSTPTPTLTPSPTATPTPTPTPLILPSRLIIEKLGINAEVEYAGVDENGKMEVPSKWENVAWYKSGPVPGEPGNVVIAGHFDTNRGRPAVFYNLEDLETGDIIQVSTIFDGSLTFQVTGKEIYPFDQVPVADIFAPGDIPRLVLITCNGYFNRGIQSYTHRIAVFSELLGSN